MTEGDGHPQGGQNTHSPLILEIGTKNHELLVNLGIPYVPFVPGQPGLQALSRRPGFPARQGIQSAIMTNMWANNRSTMLEQNVKAFITCKINTDFSYCDFWDVTHKMRPLRVT